MAGDEEENGLHLPSNRDGHAGSGSRINSNENRGNFNLRNAPSRPNSPFLHGVMARMPPVTTAINDPAYYSPLSSFQQPSIVPANYYTLSSFQQPSIVHGVRMVTDNSHYFRQIVPDNMGGYNMQSLATNIHGFQNPQFGRVFEPPAFMAGLESGASRSNIYPSANNINLATNLHGFQNPRFGRVFEPATFGDMAELQHGARSNLYPSGLMENVGYFNNTALIPSQSSVGEEFGTRNRVLQSSNQSQGNLDGSFLTLGVRGNMDHPSTRNNSRGIIPSNSGSLVYPQVTSNAQNTISNPSEAVTGEYFGLTDSTNREVAVGDNFGGSGSSTPGFQLGEIRTPERPQVDTRHIIPPNNRNLQQNTQAGQRMMHPSNLSQGSQFVSPVRDFSSQAELPNSRQYRGTDIPTSSLNSVQPSSGRSESPHFFQLFGQRVGTGEPISLNNNAQPFPDQVNRLSALNIEFSSESYATAGCTWRDQSGDCGEPPSSPTLPSSRNDRRQPPSSPTLPSSRNDGRQPPSSRTLPSSRNDRGQPPSSPTTPSSRNDHGQPPSSPTIPSRNDRGQPPSSPTTPSSRNDHGQPPSSPTIPSRNDRGQPPSGPTMPSSRNDRGQPPSSPTILSSRNNRGQPPSSPSIPLSRNDRDQPPASPSIPSSRNDRGQPPSRPSILSSRNGRGPACQAASLEGTKAPTQAPPVHIQPSHKRGASEISSPASLLQQKKARATQPNPSVPQEPLASGTPRPSARTITYCPSQLSTAKPTPHVPNSVSTSPLLTPSLPVRAPSQGASPDPSMPPNAAPVPQVSTAPLIRLSGHHAVFSRNPGTYRVRSKPVPVVPPESILAKSTPDARGKNPGLTETPKPIGEKCFLCKRDLAFAAEGPISLPAVPPVVAVLPCGHAFHDSCLHKITPQDQATNPPCIPCALGES